MNINRILFVSLMLVAIISITGCGSGTQYSTEVRKITIKTNPYHARVYQINPVDDHEIFLGISPVEDQPVSIIKNFWNTMDQETEDFMTTQVGMVNVRVEKEGFKPYRGNLATEKDETLLHRIELEVEK